MAEQKRQNLHEIAYSFRIAIVYLVDDSHFEVIAVRAYHQMQNPAQYQKSVRERIRELLG